VKANKEEQSNRISDGRRRIIKCISTAEISIHSFNCRSILRVLLLKIANRVFESFAVEDQNEP